MTNLDPLRFSRLKKFGKSAAHYLDGQDDDTSSIRKGSATHRLLLGSGQEVVTYDGARNPKHKKYKAFLAENEGKLILSKKEKRDAEGMRDAIRRHPRAMQLLNGVREQTIEWELSGRLCRGTPDVVHLSGGQPEVLVELKTTQSAKPDLFRWQVRKLAYHCQVDWYASGLQRSMFYRPKMPAECYIVAVESSRPYPVTVFRVTDALLSQGHAQWRFWFEQLLVCERTGVFPGYAESDVDLDADDEGDGLDWSEESAA